MRTLTAWIAAAVAMQDTTAETQPIRNLVIVTIDTVRADHLSCYGYFRNTTPNLDALAAQSLRFTRCLTPVAQTTPSHTCLFTGVGPFENGVVSNHVKLNKKGQAAFGLRTSPTLRTLAQVFSERGMKTGGFVSAAPVKKITGLDAGFQVWTEPDGRRQAPEVLPDILGFIEQCGDSPFFAWVHCMDAHDPLTPPHIPVEYYEFYGKEPGLTEWLSARGFPETAGDGSRAEIGTPVTHLVNTYDGALHYLDLQLATLIARLDRPDLRDSTVLVVVADHGTAIGQHSEIAHGLCWDDMFRVPLLIRVPGVKPRVVDTLMSSLDLWPVVFALAPTLAAPKFLEQCRGQNVLAPDHEPRPMLGSAARRTGDVSLTSERWKLIFNPEAPPRLFDLQSDPNELTNVAVANPDRVAAMSKMIAAQIADQKQRRQVHLQGASAGTVLDGKTLRELRELGYTDDDSKDGDSDDGDSKTGDDEHD